MNTYIYSYNLGGNVSHLVSTHIITYMCLYTYVYVQKKHSNVSEYIEDKSWVLHMSKFLLLIDF